VIVSIVSLTFILFKRLRNRYYLCIIVKQNLRNDKQTAPAQKITNGGNFYLENMMN